MRSTRQILNEGSLNKLADAAKLVNLGDALALVPRTVRAAVTTNVLTLPESAKCAVLLSVYVTAGTVTGRFTPLVAEATPATTEAAPTAGGNVAFKSTDAVTEAEVSYLAYEGAIHEDTCVVASDVATLLGGRAAAVILEVESLAGTVAGNFTVAARGTTPATTEAAIQDDPTGVEFAAADVVTSARIRYVAQPGVGSEADAVGVRLDVEDKQF